MIDRSSFAIVPFSGNLDLIDKFYSLLGMEACNGSVKFKDFEIMFGNKVFQIEKFEIIIEIDSDLDQVEKQLVDMGCTIIEHGFSSGGPFFVTTDPSGLIVVVGLNQEGLKKLMSTRNSD